MEEGHADAPAVFVAFDLARIGIAVAGGEPVIHAPFGEVPLRHDAEIVVIVFDVRFVNGFGIFAGACKVQPREIVVTVAPALVQPRVHVAQPRHIDDIVVIIVIPRGVRFVDDVPLCEILVVQPVVDAVRVIDDTVLPRVREGVFDLAGLFVIARVGVLPIRAHREHKRRKAERKQRGKQRKQQHTQ